MIWINFKPLLLFRLVHRVCNPVSVGQLIYLHVWSPRSGNSPHLIFLVLIFWPGRRASDDWCSESWRAAATLITFYCRQISSPWITNTLTHEITVLAHVRAIAMGALQREGKKKKLSSTITTQTPPRFCKRNPSPRPYPILLTSKNNNSYHWWALPFIRLSPTCRQSLTRLASS